MNLYQPKTRVGKVTDFFFKNWVNTMVFWFLFMGLWPFMLVGYLILKVADNSEERRREQDHRLQLEANEQRFNQQQAQKRKQRIKAVQNEFHEAEQIANSLQDPDERDHAMHILEMQKRQRLEEVMRRSGGIQ